VKKIDLKLQDVFVPAMSRSMVYRFSDITGWLTNPTKNKTVFHHYFSLQRKNGDYEYIASKKGQL